MTARAEPFSRTAVLALLVAALAVPVLLLAGLHAVSVAAVLLCIAMMAVLYRESGDFLDVRAAFFTAALLFVVLPGVVIDATTTDTHYWRSSLVSALVITRPQMLAAMTVVLIGMTAVAVPLLLTRGSGRVRISNDARVVHGRVWLLYAGFCGFLLLLAAFHYGSWSELALSAITPQLRRSANRVPLAGLTGLIQFLAASAAFHAATRLQSRAARLLLFAPIILLAVPAGNRGTVLTLGLIALASVTPFTHARPFRFVLLGCVALPLLASLMWRLRTFVLLEDWSAFSWSELYGGFTQESMMLPTFAYALRGLQTHEIGYAFGTDLVLLPLWYVPRILWRAKPYPLDFRLNADLGLNDGDVFGTPVSLFGGAWLNFTPVVYVPALILLGVGLVWARRRIAGDRLLAVIAFTFIIDLVRVGDISREVMTLTLALVAVWLVRLVATRRVNPEWP